MNKYRRVNDVQGLALFVVFASLMLGVVLIRLLDGGPL